MSAVLAGIFGLAAQNVIEETVSFDRLVYDFGDIMISDGPQTCQFNVRNISDRPVAIYRVVTSCGCAEPSWTEAPIMPGGTGEISVVFTNDQGPYPFSKSVTAYISGITKPVVLKVKGVAHDKAKSLSDLFPIACGPLGFREKVVSMGQVEQGLTRSMEVEVANTSGRDIELGFADMTPGLSVSADKSVIPAKSKARITCVVNTRLTDGEKWGKIPFTFSVVVNGKKYPSAFTVEALIKENFSDLTEEQMRAGALPQFEASSLELGLVEKGTVLSGKFTFKNMGKDSFVIYKAEASEPGLSFTLPDAVPYGGKGTIEVSVDTSGQSGEVLNILTLITNSPKRPIINLFVAYTVK